MAKTIAQEQFEVKHAQEMEVATRELMRRSHDTIRVYNPLGHTFSFMYDRFWHRVPAESYKDMERYLAMKFYKNICDKMIGDQIGKRGADLKAVREKQMGQQFLDKYDENVQIWDKMPKMDDPELMAQIFKTVIIGVVEEYGADEPDMIEGVPDKPADYRPAYEQMFDSLVPVSADVELPATIDELKGMQELPAVEEKTVNIKKEDLAKEVIANEAKK